MTKITIFFNHIKNKLSPTIFVVLTASIFALSVAYIAEFVFAFPPCMLCIYQRIFYFILVLLSFISLIWPNLQTYLFWIIVITLLGEIAIALYHVGVEHYIFEDSYVCDVHNEFTSLAQNLLAGRTVENSCSQVTFKFMNFSMAEWNLFYATAILYWILKNQGKK